MERSLSRFFIRQSHDSIFPLARQAVDKNVLKPIQKEILASSQFRVFAVLWAIAALFHMAHSSVFNTSVNFALLTLAALYVIIRPSVFPFTVFIMLQVFDAIYRMPFTTNHWIFTAFVNLTILQVLVVKMLKQKTFFVNDGELISAFSPVVMIEVIILYFFTAFHKLNAGFFAPATSCATYLLEAQNIGSLIPLTPALLKANSYFTVVLEFLIPLLLCFRKTRIATIILGFFFHGVLAYSTYNAFYDFSSMIFAVYFLFCPVHFGAKIVSTLDNLKLKLYAMFRTFNLTRLLVAGALGGVLMVIVYILTKKFHGFESVNLYFFWTGYCLIYLVFLVHCVATEKMTNRSESKGDYSFVHWSFFLFPVVVFLNAMSPYLGLKTENSFAMFSNLRTEGGQTNHYIIPASFQIFDFQKDVVEVISSSDPALQKLADEHNLVVLFEFRIIILEHKPKHVTYLLNGEKKKFVFNKENDGVMRAQNNYVLSKLMKFRQFSKYDSQPCKH
jgi:hypothetical protein